AGVADRQPRPGRQRVLRCRLALAAVDLEPEDGQRHGHARTLGHAARVEHRDPAGGGQPQLAAVHAPAGRPAAAVGLAAGHAVLASEPLLLKLRRAALVDGVERIARDPDHAVVAADPEVVELVAQYPEHAAARQPLATAIQPVA